MSARLDTKLPAAALAAEAEVIRRAATATRVRGHCAPDLPTEAALGRYADTPMQVPLRGWFAVLRRTLWEVISDRVSLVAAGCAFYATLGLFPAISMLISVYGLVFDPVTVEPQLQHLQRLVPAAAFHLIDDRVRMVVSQPVHTLGLGLLISAVATLWTAATGTKSVLSALNIAYEETETRSFLRYQVTALVMTLAGMLAGIVGLAALVGIPAAFAFLGLSAYAARAIGIASVAGMALFVGLSLALLYRYGPCRRSPRWLWVLPGSVVATVLWLLASTAFSYYVGHMSTYDTMYGPLGAVVGLMMWFWVSVLSMLIGAELNAELELQTAHDTTAGTARPMGRRGAFVADHVAE